MGASALGAAEGRGGGHIGQVEEVPELEDVEPFEVEGPGGVAGPQALAFTAELLQFLHSLGEDAPAAVDPHFSRHERFHAPPDVMGHRAGRGRPRFPALPPHPGELQAGRSPPRSFRARGELGYVIAGPPAEHGQIHEAVGAEPVGAVDGNAGAFPRGVEALIGFAGGRGRDPAAIVRRDAAHGVVGGRENGDGHLRRVDAEVCPAEPGDVGELGLECRFPQRGGVEDDVVPGGPVAVEPSAFPDLRDDGPRDDVARGQVEKLGRVALHEALAGPVPQDAALAADRLGDENAEAAKPGGVELEELHVFEGDAAAGEDRQPVAGAGVGVGRDPIHAAESARGHEDRLGPEKVDLPRGQVDGDDAGGGPAVEDDVEHMELVEKGDLVLDALLVERLEDHVAGPVAGIARTADRRLAEVPRVAAEAPLVDPAVRRAVEGQAAMLEVDDGLDRLFGQDERRALVDEIVAALDRVEGVPLGPVLFDIAQGGADPALGRSRVGAEGMDFRQDGRPDAMARPQGGVKAGPSGADDHGVMLVEHELARAAHVSRRFGKSLPLGHASSSPGAGAIPGCPAGSWLGDRGRGPKPPRREAPAT